MELTSQEKLMLRTQILQFVSINFNTMIQNFQQVKDRGGLSEPRLTDMQELFVEVNQDLENVTEKLLDRLDSWDALGEDDATIINPMLEALNITNN